MFYVEEFTREKQAGVVDECQDIMNRIYTEDPSYWPYGLNVDGHNGGVYLVKDSKTKQAVGFTGWQVAHEGFKKVGYYSIGILPEFRGNGFAKAALSKLIRVKSATVDEVRAFIAPHNKPSIELANRLGIAVTHEG